MASNNYRIVSCAVLFILPRQWQTAGPTSVLCQLLDKIQACKFKSYWHPLKIKIHPSQHELLNNSAVIPQTEHARAKKKTLLSYCQKMCIKGTRSFEKYGKNWLGCDIFYQEGLWIYVLYLQGAQSHWTKVCLIEWLSFQLYIN